jgi:hypothetical protein
MVWGFSNRSGAGNEIDSEIHLADGRKAGDVFREHIGKVLDNRDP